MRQQRQIVENELEALSQELGIGTDESIQQAIYDSLTRKEELKNSPMKSNAQLAVDYLFKRWAERNGYSEDGIDDFGDINSQDNSYVDSQLNSSVSDSVIENSVDSMLENPEEIDKPIVENNNKNGIIGNGSKEVTLNYKPSSGVILKSTPRKTTTILGSYSMDMESIIKELDLEKTLNFGARDGGFNVLNVPDELYISPDQFWNEYNKPWLDNVMERSDIIVLATEPNFALLTKKDKLTGIKYLSGFGREFKYLKNHGYEYDTNTKSMRKRYEG